MRLVHFSKTASKYLLVSVYQPNFTPYKIKRKKPNELRKTASNKTASNGTTLTASNKKH